MTTRSIIFLLGFIICLNADYSFSEDIVLKSGKIYKDINVFKQEADRLLVTYPGGATTIYLKDCTEDIQRKYNYNTTAADTAISEREKTVQAAHKQRQRDEKRLIENLKKQEVAKERKKAALAQLENKDVVKNKGEVKNKTPLVACLMSSGPSIVNYDKSTMRRIISYSNTRDKKKGLIVADKYGGSMDLYYVDHPARLNQLLEFISHNYDLPHVSAKYVSEDYLSGLRGPEAVYESPSQFSQ